MSKLPWKPWHKVVALRDEMRSRDLAMSLFAADLYDVVMGTARPIYADPREFFAQTYPTYNLREIAKDVCHRLARQSDKSIRQLALTYGGGKTHTLVTLYHLFHDPKSLPADLPAVREFLSHMSASPPQARVAVLPFDKLDVETGMDVRGPAGEVRRLRHPWSVLAFQLAGVDGLRTLTGGTDSERDSPPAEPLVVDLLARPAQAGLATLVLIDETLMFVRQKVIDAPAWREKMVDFFQYLTQAAVKTPGCAVVVSLLATDPRKSDTLGKELMHEMSAIFSREREEIILPVQKEEVAEVLRRRFFRPETIREVESFRPHVVAALEGVKGLDDSTRKEGRRAEDRYVASYPFHPELTEVLYARWGQMESFQRTRGVLRTFAMALRDAEASDDCPLVGPNIFLKAIGSDGLSHALRELSNTASAEEYEGKKQDWSGILEGELSRARDAQAEFGGLGHRELEQAVVATFLHSQPINHRASVRDLMLLLGTSRPDRIDLEKGLRRWAGVSWFLDDNTRSEAESGLPRTWQLGVKPNLTQMHHDARNLVQGPVVEEELLTQIGKLKSLTAGVRDSGVTPHSLPARPRDVEDDGEFHYAVLGPKAASSSGNPSAEAKRFLDEKTGPDAPRVYRNALVLAVPARDGLEVARERIRDHLAWLEVEHQLKGQEIDPLRQKSLDVAREAAARAIPDAIRQAYSVVVCVSKENEAQAFKLNLTGEPLFAQIRTDPRSRIQESAVTAAALLPDGPYNLWHEGETSRRVKDLAGAFAQYPHLPRMLRAGEILSTLAQGAADGWFVLRLPRPDHTFRTFWRQAVPAEVLAEPALEVVLPDDAELAEVPAELLEPGVLPELWTGQRLRLSDLEAYFIGGKVVQVKHETHEEPMIIPKANPLVVRAAAESAVQQGKLWLLAGAASIWREAVLSGVLTGDADLLPPPKPIHPAALLADALPAAWSGGQTTGRALLDGLSAAAGDPLPWPLVGEAISAAIQARMLERSVDSGPWPCDLAGAAAVRLRVPSPHHLPPIVGPISPPVAPASSLRTAEAELSVNDLQDVSEAISQLNSAAVGHGLRIVLRLEVGTEGEATAELVGQLNRILDEAQVKPGLRFG
jgi:hypothetical protein